jgi:hypothetical protein
VFTPFAPLLQRRIPTLKWKEKKNITVDFLVQPNYDLMVVDKGETVRVAKASNQPSIVKTKIDILLRRGEAPIVECTWTEASQNWRFKKIRTDKPHPNSMMTFRNSLKNLREDIKIAELFD